MSTFKPGDRVRAVKPSWGDEHAPVGAVGTVIWAPSGLSVHFHGYSSPPSWAGPPALDGDGWSMLESQIVSAGCPLLRPFRRLREHTRTRVIKAEFQRRRAAGLL